MNRTLPKTILLLLMLFIGAFSMYDYLHALHLDEHIEETAHHCNSKGHDQDSNSGCLCVYNISLLYMDFIYNYEIDFTSTYVSIQHDLIPQSPFLNPPERPPQAA